MRRDVDPRDVIDAYEYAQNSLASYEGSRLPELPKKGKSRELKALREQTQLRAYENRAIHGLAQQGRHYIAESTHQSRTLLTGIAAAGRRVIDSFPDGSMQREHEAVITGQFLLSARAMEHLNQAESDFYLGQVRRGFDYPKKKGWFR